MLQSSQEGPRGSSLSLVGSARLCPVSQLSAASREGAELQAAVWDRDPAPRVLPKVTQLLATPPWFWATLALVPSAVTARSLLVSCSQSGSITRRGETPASAGCGADLSSDLCWGAASPCVWVPGEGLILSALQSSGTYPWELVLSLNISLAVSLHPILHPWPLGQCLSQLSLFVALSLVPEKHHILFCPAGPVGAPGQ